MDDNGACSYERFLRGDQSGIVEIIRDYKDGLMLYLNGYVGNIHIAEELMEDTFVRVAVKRPRFFARSSFKTWLYSIGRNIAVDYIRKSTRLRAVTVQDAAVAAEEETLIEAYIREERRRVIHRALDEINPEYRRVLYLFYFEDFTPSDIARIMRKGRKQIENLLYRAKQSLKTTLEKEGFVYEEL